MTLTYRDGTKLCIPDDILIEHIRSQVEAYVNAESLVEDCGVESVQEKLTQSDEDRVKQLVRQELKGRDNEKIIFKLIQNVLGSLFKTFYVRRSFWRDSLSTSSQ